QVYVILFCVVRVLFVILFFMYVAPPAIYTLSLHDALPISSASSRPGGTVAGGSPPSADVRTLRCVAQTWSWYRGLPVAPAAGSRKAGSIWQPSWARFSSGGSWPAGALRGPRRGSGSGRGESLCAESWGNALGASNNSSEM